MSPVVLTFLVVCITLYILYRIFSKNAKPLAERVIEKVIEVPTWEFLGIYKRKAYLFDSTTEFKLFKILTELYGDKYFIFPQVNYSHFVEVKAMSKYEMRPYRSRIDKKSADFVLCDKQRVVPQLVLELDGYTHTWDTVIERDSFIDKLMQDIGLPIVHLKTNNMAVEVIKKTIDEKLHSSTETLQSFAKH